MFEYRKSIAILVFLGNLSLLYKITRFLPRRNSVFPALFKIISDEHGHECTTQNLSRLAYEHNHC